MSEKEANRFIEDLKASPEFQTEMQELRSTPQKAFEHVLDRGYDVTTFEIRDAFLEFASNAYSEEQLAEITGGLSTGGKVGIIVGATVAGGVLGTVAIGSTVAIVSVVIGSSAAAGI